MIYTTKSWTIAIAAPPTSVARHSGRRLRFLLARLSDSQHNLHTMLREQALKVTRSRLTIAKQISALSETEIAAIETRAGVLPGTFAGMLADPEKAKLLDFLHFRLLSQVVLPQDEETQADLASPGLLMAGQDLDDQRIPFADDVEHRRDVFQRNLPYQDGWEPELWPAVMEALGMDIDDAFALATKHHPIGIDQLLKMFELYAQRYGERRR